MGRSAGGSGHGILRGLDLQQGCNICYRAYLGTGWILRLKDDNGLARGGGFEFKWVTFNPKLLKFTSSCEFLDYMELK